MLAYTGFPTQISQIIWYWKEVIFDLALRRSTQFTMLFFCLGNQKCANSKTTKIVRALSVSFEHGACLIQ